MLCQICLLTVRQLVGEMLFAGDEPHERPVLVRDVVS
jgi:hypothetical protein